MIIANKPLNKQAIAIEEAETKIRLMVQEEYIKGSDTIRMSALANKIIKQCRAEIDIPSLNTATTKSLMAFYREQVLAIRKVPRERLKASKILSEDKEPTPNEKKELAKQGIEVKNKKVNVPKRLTYGVPMRKYAKDYYDKYVKPTYERLIEQFPKDPDDISGHNTLRNLAEMEVRHKAHQDEIEDFKAQGINLVIASTHADCSERCRPWQGKVYSLDGTKGVTDDGRKYVPLEYATKSEKVKHVTKSGKVYYNGLLGYNCRHYLVPYKKGYRFPKPNVKDERREYAITLRQRELERQVRKWRTIAVTKKNVNRQEYLEARRKAIEWNKQYIEFSQKNGRAYYPSRTKLI